MGGEGRKLILERKILDLWLVWCVDELALDAVYSEPEMLGRNELMMGCTWYSIACCFTRSGIIRRVDGTYA